MSQEFLSEDISSDHLSTDYNFFQSSEPRADEVGDLVHVNYHTKLALQIFSLDPHPSVYKQGNSCKEGLSLYALFNRCVSTIGQIKLRKIFDQPIYNVDVLNRRLDLVEFFIKRPEIRYELKSYLKNIYEPSGILERLRVADLSVSDWKKLTKTLESTISIYKILHKVPHPTFHLANQYLSAAKIDDLWWAHNCILQVVDFRESNKEGTFQIKQNVNPDVDRLRKILRDLPNVLIVESKKELTKYQNHIDNCCMDYEPLLGFHLQVILSPNRLVIGNYRIPGLEYKFQKDDISYYKSPTAYAMDEHYGDILTDICNMQRMYQAQLQSKIMPKVESLKELATFSAELDSFIAIAETCSAFKFTRPTFTSGNVIEIKDGRHPLQELFVQKFISNSFVSRENEKKVHVITGPNACGKSVYLKQICLIVYMSQIGSFVPAEYVRLTPVDRIFTRIKSNESISTGESTYLSDIKQIADICQEYSDNSLIVIDEFGKSTDFRSGLALLSALVDFFIEHEKTAHILITTHFLSLPKHIRYHEKVFFKTFQVSLMNDIISYGYKLLDGISPASYGILVAKAVGISPDIVERAFQVKQMFENNNLIEPLKKQSSVKSSRRLIYVAELFEKVDLDSCNPLELLDRFKQF